MTQEKIDTSRIVAELRILQNRVLELEELVSGFKTAGACVPVVPLSPALWTQEKFPAEITADNSDGTYQARRLIAPDRNTFSYDDEDTSLVTVGNVAERNGYTGMYSTGNIVLVQFDGLNEANEAIYHIW